MDKTPQQVGDHLRMGKQQLVTGIVIHESRTPKQ
jgi:hypothetical protein